MASDPTMPPAVPSRMDARMRRVVATRRIFPFLALVTLAVAFAAIAANVLLGLAAVFVGLRIGRLV